MTTPTDSSRLPRSIRKHLRLEKARLRRTLEPAAAEKAVRQLMQRYHPEADAKKA